MANSLVALVAILAIVAVSHAQTVTINVDLTGANWIIGGQSDPVVTLVVGTTYNFVIANVNSADLFCFSTTQTVGQTNLLASVTGNCCEDCTITYTPTASDPSSFFYKSARATGPSAAPNGATGVVNLVLPPAPSSVAVPDAAPSAEAPAVAPSAEAPAVAPSVDAPAVVPSAEASSVAPSVDVPVVPSAEASSVAPSVDVPVVPSAEAPSAPVVDAPSAVAPVPDVNCATASCSECLASPNCDFIETSFGNGCKPRGYCAVLPPTTCTVATVCAEDDCFGVTGCDTCMNTDISSTNTQKCSYCQSADGYACTSGACGFGVALQTCPTVDCYAAANCGECLAMDNGSGACGYCAGQLGTNCIPNDNATQCGYTQVPVTVCSPCDAHADCNSCSGEMSTNCTWCGDLDTAGATQSCYDGSTCPLGNPAFPCATSPMSSDAAPSVTNVAPSVEVVAPSVNTVAPSVEVVAPSVTNVAPSVEVVAPSVDVGTAPTPSVTAQVPATAPSSKATATPSSGPVTAVKTPSSGPSALKVSPTKTPSKTAPLPKTIGAANVEPFVPLTLALVGAVVAKYFF